MCLPACRLACTSSLTCAHAHTPRPALNTPNPLAHTTRYDLPTVRHNNLVLPTYCPSRLPKNHSQTALAM
ncbi:hypothetical protein LY76DRAFT_374292 [Colletotrichum caudatum]|nr:hypothetical protein LY76DRAFT_374292 [Colletotrichum caudatum]